MFNYESIVSVPRLTQFQYVIGAVGILLLMEACRVVSGLPIVCVAIAFLLVGIFGQSMPGFLANRGFSLQVIIKHLFLAWKACLARPSAPQHVYLPVHALWRVPGKRAWPVFHRLRQRLAGSRRGGPAKVTVLTSALEGTVSGSSVANTVGSARSPSR